MESGKSPGALDGETVYLRFRRKKIYSQIHAFGWLQCAVSSAQSDSRRHCSRKKESGERRGCLRLSTHLVLIALS